MIYIIPIVYVFMNVIHAVWHFHLITQLDKTINSVQKTVEYLVLLLVAFFLLLPFSNWLPLVILPIVTRAAFFDGLLNVFRGKQFLYEGEISKKKSWWDYIESEIGLPTWFYRLLYIAAYIGYLIYYLNNAN